MFALLWIVLTGAATEALAYGAVAAFAAAVLSLKLYPPDRPGVGAWPVVMFLPRFLVQSVVGGLDVARRALDPRLPVAPGWVELPLASRQVEANVLLGGVVSILPGTLAAGPGDGGGDGDGAMAVHVLNLPSFASADFHSEEQRVLGLFGPRVIASEAPHG